MFKKGSKLYSIFNGKCPQCHEGDFFKHKMTLNPSKITQLHDNCPKCNLKYMMEPSFFFGAMYVNYGLAVALFVAIFIISKVFIGLTILQSFIAIVVVSLLLTPFTLRLSRIIWINIFISYDKNAKKLNDKRLNEKKLDDKK
ncbi:DUF983 domain-containing protein [Tenacibaculum piscium]|uniref:DUF983 domain-containing protein n=2 Tax=Tenacibaculum piscium TaxID=1458515 RepID=A0A2H1YIN9_9FLAO|nr:DUF983 domain-containing protein [Tenacibaculum piscium]MBE7628548.1 DUF983 domain-containing protein [Tenacibaculum piscium]MBE7669689.1 DUF983 domain-containing protein [Tenacibaculum piscium]MBE7684723.1 DUF983 domain-containing protein [Tenacibaculum piscium]MBE7689343.1 DUF983 domain-containing protein [Tenacibaculum piscium]SOS75338.1 conserved hypothetical protein [Tenacibaculum piscium]